MAKYGILVDVTRCNGCYNCFIAWKDEYCGNDHPPYSASQPMTGQFWMKINEKERGKYPHVKVSYTPMPCMHCEKPKCMEIAGDCSIYKREDGIVIIDPREAKGRKDLVSACPYRVIYWNEEKQVPQKCTMCAHLLDQGWKEPRCVEACPTGALLFGDLDNPESEISRALADGRAAPLHPEYRMNEKVRYIGLPGKFIAGSLVFKDTDRCAEGVTVTLTGEGEKKSQKTDNYGDFEFEDLQSDKQYTVDIDSPGYKSRSFEVKTLIDVFLGEIFLERTASRQKAGS